MDLKKFKCIPGTNKKGQELMLKLSGHFWVDPDSGNPHGQVNGELAVNNSFTHNGHGILFHFLSGYNSTDVSIFIDELEVNDTGCGNGTYILQQILIFLSEINREYPQITFKTIQGVLSQEDREKGNWEKSIPFYKNFVNKVPTQFTYDLKLKMDECTLHRESCKFCYLLTPRES